MSMHAMHSCSLGCCAPLTRKQQWRRMHSKTSRSPPCTPPTAAAMLHWNCLAHQRKSSGDRSYATPPLPPSPPLSPPPRLPPHLRCSGSKGANLAERPEVETIITTESRRPGIRCTGIDLSPDRTSPTSLSSSWRHAPRGVDDADASGGPGAGAGGDGAGASCDGQVDATSPLPSFATDSPAGETTPPGEMESTSRGGAEATPSLRARKSVRFNRCVRMVLVPSRRDLDAETACRVWWGRDDLARFRSAAAKLFLKQQAMEKATAEPQKSASGGTASRVPLEEERRVRNDWKGSCEPGVVGPIAAAPLPSAVQVS